MITAKFGGTAITPSNLIYVKQCLTPCHKCVAVSAVGREFSNDIKVTDLLKQYYFTHSIEVWDAIEDKYRRLAEVNAVDIDIDKTLFDARGRALKYNLDYCMSLGEELSAKVVAAYLGAAYIEAEQIIRFGARSLRYKATLDSIRSAFEGVGLAVTGGFYGGAIGGRRTFARGGSDITGALCAAALDCTLYENWTDSYGVNVVNPVKAWDVSTVLSLSYDEMFALSNAGAEVLHPDAVEPCRTRGIPIKIGNYYNPNGPSTLVSNCPSRKAVLSVAERVDKFGNTITTLLHSLPPSELCRLLGGYFSLNEYAVTNYRFDRGLSCNVSGNADSGCAAKEYCAERTRVLNFACGNRTAALTTDKSVIADLYKYLKTSGYVD